MKWSWRTSLLTGYCLAVFVSGERCLLGAATLRIGPGPDPEYIQLQPTTEPAKFYMLQSTADLQSPAWKDLQSIPGTGMTERRFQPVDNNQPAFYRLKEMAPSDAPMIVTTLQGQPQFTSRGIWYGSSLGGYLGRPTRFSVEFDAMCVWRPAEITPGRYRVHVYFPAHFNSTRQAEYTIVSESGVDVIILNQATNGGRWIQLGDVYSFSPEKCMVQLKRRSAIGALRADAVLFEPVPAAEEILVQAELNTIGFDTVGEWIREKGTAWAGQAAFHAASSDAVCQWRPAVISYGTYQVYAYMAPGLTDSMPAEYTIGSLSGIETVHLDQGSFEGQWVPIGGVHRFAPGYGYVQLRPSRAGGQVTASAIKFVPADGPQTAHLWPVSRSAFSIGSIAPTLFFKNASPLRQYALLTLVHRGFPEYARFTVKIGDQVVSRQNLGPVFGIGQIQVEMPDVAQPTLLTCTLQSLTDPNASDERILEWRPQKKWKIYLMETAHTDLGYEHYVRMKHSYLMDWTDKALGLVQANTHQEYRLGYHFFFEHLWWFLHYEHEKGPEQTEWMLAFIRDQRASFGGTPTLGHGAWMGGEETARFTYPLMQEVRHRYGVTGGRTAYYADVDLPAWSTAQALAQAGYAALAVAPSDWRLDVTFGDRLARSGMSPLFYWQMPNGRDRLLTFIGEAYARGLNVHYEYGLSREYYQGQVASWLSALEASGYAYDAVLTTHYHDDEPPNLEAYPFVEAWNREFRYPEIIHNAPLDRFFDYIVATYSNLPVYHGELNNPWADYAAIDVTQHGAKRDAALLAATGETLATLASYCDSDYAYPFAALHKLYAKFNEFNEHSWPTLPTANDFHVVNTKYYKTQAARQFLKPQAEGILQNAFRTILNNIATRGRTVVVFNPSLQPRSAYAQVPTDQLGYEHFNLRNTATGSLVPHQKLSSGHTLFFADKMPALGYRGYLVEPREDPPLFSSSLAAQGSSLSNRFYALQLDPATGAIVSLLDLDQGVELVQPGQLLNRYIYRHNPHGQKLNAVDYSPENGFITIEETGPLRAVLRATSSEKQSGADIVQRIIMYHDLKRIDIVNELTAVDKMYQPFSSFPYENADVRYRDNIFYAFPFLVPNPRFHIAAAAGTVFDFMDPAPLLWANLSDKDFVSLDNWAHIAGPDYGVTLASPDAPILHLGGIRYNQRSTAYLPTNSAVYSHVQSSRLGPHNFLQVEDCNHRVRYSITSGRGGWAQSGAPRFGHEIAVNLLAGVVPSWQPGRWTEPAGGSLLGVKPANIELSVLKQSEEPGRGIIVRLRETEGRDNTKAVLSFNLFTPAAAYLTDLSESKDAAVSLPIDGQFIRVDMGKFDWVTIRIRAHANVPPLWSLAAEKIEDGRVTLRWPALPSAHGYNVYRSGKSGFEPHAYNRIGYSGQPEFIDRGLSPGTAYYYKVAAVNRFNEQGPCAETAVLTATVNRTPPEPVSGFMAMTLPNANATARIGLCWERSQESDIAYYLLYRSTTPNFSASPTDLVGVLGDDGRYIQQWFDSWGLLPNTTYYYQVKPVDTAENEQPISPETEVTTLVQ